MDTLTHFGNFSDLTIRLSKLNKLFINVIEYELENNAIYEINATQALTLKNIGESKTSIGKATSNGYYIGKNISYNISALLKKGYIVKQKDNIDKRCIYLVITEKGVEILHIVNKILLCQYDTLTKVGIKDNYIENINSFIDKLQTVLDNNIKIQ